MCPGLRQLYHYIGPKVKGGSGRNQQTNGSQADNYSKSQMHRQDGSIEWHPGTFSENIKIESTSTITRLTTRGWKGGWDSLDLPKLNDTSSTPENKVQLFSTKISKDPTL